MLVEFTNQMFFVVVLILKTLPFLVSDHFDQNGSGPKRTIQTAVARLNSPKNLFERPRETLLLTKTRCKRNFFFLKIREIFSIFFHFDRGDPMKIEKKSDFYFKKKYFCLAFSSIIGFPEASRTCFSANLGPQLLSVWYFLDRSHSGQNDH